MSSCLFYVRSGTAESINKANKEMRVQTAVDLLNNACMLLIKLEWKRFYKMKKDTWGDTIVLTPRGIEEYEATFTFLICVNLMTILRRGYSYSELM